MLHFGEHDEHIPLLEVMKIRAAYPHLPVYTYDAGHGFNCEARKDYDLRAAATAWQRTADFFAQHL
jgi:carboxymethylenebutenolidase